MNLQAKKLAILIKVPYELLSLWNLFMNEEEWLTSTNPMTMLYWLTTEPKKSGNDYRLSDRLLRLFAAACYPDDLMWREWADKELSGSTGMKSTHFTPIEGAGHACGIKVGQHHETRLSPEEKIHTANLLREVFGNPFNPIRLALSESASWEQLTTIKSIAQSIYDENRWNEMPILADALMEAGMPETETCIYCFEGQVGYQPKGPAGQLIMGKKCLVCKGTGKVTNRILEHCRTTVMYIPCWACARTRKIHGDDLRCNAKCTGFTEVPKHVRGCHVLDLILGKD